MPCIRLYLAALAAVATLLLSGCNGSASEGRKPQTADSLYNEERAMAIYDSLPEQALQILDSAEAAGNLTDYRAALLRAKVLSSSTAMQQQDSAFMICETLLQQDEAKRNVDFRQDVLELLVNSSRCRYDYEEMVRWTTELATLLRDEHLEAEALRTEADLGLALTHIGQEDEGLAKIDNCIRQLENIRKFNELDAWLIAVKRKLNVLTEQGHDETLMVELATRMQQRLDDFAAHPDDYHDDTYREPDKEDIPFYHDFYYAQACAFKARAYAIQGNLVAAQREVDAFSKYPYGQSLDGRLMMAPTLGRLGDYDAVLSTYDEAEQKLLSEGDTVNGRLVEILHGRAEIAYAQATGTATANSSFSHSSLKKAYDYLNRYENLKNMLNDDLQRSKAQLYAARYHAYEQQMEIRQQETEASRNAVLAVAALLLALSATGFAVYYFRQQRLIQKKNRVLIEQMTEAATLKVKSEELRVRNEENNVKSDAEKNNDKVDLNALTTKELSEHIRAVIIRERLFLDPLFDRQAAVKYFHLKKERIGAAFAQGSEHNSIADFINHCRLEYAKEQLATCPEMTIDDIASAAGFGTRRTFSRLFKERYSITPTEYRNQNSGLTK